MFIFILPEIRPLPPPSPEERGLEPMMDEVLLKKTRYYLFPVISIQGAF